MSTRSIKRGDLVVVRSTQQSNIVMVTQVYRRIFTEELQPLTRPFWSRFQW